ncbi:hypothetical protein KVV02_002919 [Mortierella alpina]|uniref:Uncharacterized protein n=1 Tax=Mortierella alpina TaxID=64518 RepID=A0A9P8CZK0_MORAP|nr:hypothetical protein KVV02_002919 [Mortierella alpina]
MVFTRKGDLIVTGGEDQIVRLRDIETGVCRGSLSGHSEGIRTVALSPDGRHIASAGDEGVLRLWEVESGMTRTTSSGAGYTVLSVGPSPKGASIISVNGGGTVSAWNMQSGECSQYLTEREEKACSVAISPCGGQIACGTTSGSIQLRNLESGAYCGVLSGVEHRDNAVSSIAYSPNGGQIVSCSKDCSVKIWDAGTGDRLHLFSNNSKYARIRLFACSPTAEQFATVISIDETITLWDVEVGTFRILQGHSKPISSIAYSPTGEEIASASRDMTIRLWNTTSGACRFVLSGYDTGAIQVLYSPNGCEIAACYEDNTIRFWNAETGDCRSTLTTKTSGKFSDIAYSPTGAVIASTHSDGTVQLWNVESGDCQTTLQYDLAAEKEIGTQIDAVTEISRSKCSDTDDSPGQVGHISTGSGVARQAQEQKHRKPVTYICFSSRGDLVATHGYNVEVVLWDVLTGKHRRTFHAVISVQVCTAKPVFSPNGSRFVNPHSTTAVRVWDVDTGARLLTLDHETLVKELLYSPKGDLIASGTRDATVKLWNAESGPCHRPVGHRIWSFEPPFWRSYR